MYATGRNSIAPAAVPFSTCIAHSTSRVYMQSAQCLEGPGEGTHRQISLYPDRRGRTRFADPRRGQEGSVSKGGLAKTVPPFTQALYKVISECVICVPSCDNKSAACETDVVVKETYVGSRISLCSDPVSLTNLSKRRYRWHLRRLPGPQERGWRELERVRS